MKEKQKVYRKAVIKKGKAYKFGQTLKKGEEVLIEEICIGRGRYVYVAFKSNNMVLGLPVAPSQFEYTDKERYVVMVTRISHCTKSFEVEAINREQAENLANEAACNTEFGEDDAEYKIDSVFTKKQWDDMRGGN